MPYLIKENKIVKLPRATGSVKDALRRATIKAQKQGWNRIVIIGEGTEGGSTIHSRMSSYIAIALCEIAKQESVRDILG